MRTLKLLTLALLATLLLTACGGAQSAEAPLPMATAAADTMSNTGGVAPGAPAALESYAEKDEEARQQPASDQPASQRMVIKTAYLSIEVPKVSDAEASIRARAEQLGGYVVSVQTSGSGDYQTASITIRVPSAQYSTAISDVEGLATKVLSRNLGGEDVTEEFVDLESRLRNLEATRTRLLDLLNQATDVEDAIQVNAALTDVQGQIEVIQGRMKYLKDSVAMATISVDLRPVPPQPTIVPEDGWQPLRVARQALGDLVSFGQGLLELGIVLLIWTPVWLPLLLLIRWGWRKLRRKAPTT
ncbi:hypothetical protein OSCT_1252 [Oscillochloris trichoides DG-6]|uniref:DUF4349 domain-containing protein n=1 Tax=Oscillochloris trichoides DG-6 TaxID=765420 RepID=E1ID51_9CHLR|nr:DUF4349 domain-containing protein [Oscillochloris trichoides]EFO80883.1 hypothetical protein OSCT_1252 [Oscillochloris trichoides DG-6]